MKKIIAFTLFVFLSSNTFSQINQPKEIQTAQKFGDYTVYYTVFNSKFIPPQVAEVYKLTRGKDIAFINISLTKTEKGTTSLGLPAAIKVKAINLLQQTKTIEFREIKEASDNGISATYYLAPLRYTNEEDFRFELSVLPNGETTPLALTFNRRLYTEN
jgi:hypothetical protein